VGLSCVPAPEIAQLKTIEAASGSWLDRKGWGNMKGVLATEWRSDAIGLQNSKEKKAGSVLRWHRRGRLSGMKVYVVALSSDQVS
jgi:hypothetical protein